MATIWKCAIHDCPLQYIGTNEKGIHEFSCPVDGQLLYSSDQIILLNPDETNIGK